MKYYVIVKSDEKKAKHAQFTVEPCTERMSAIDVRDALKVILEDMAKCLIRSGMAPVLEVSEATRNMRVRHVSEHMSASRNMGRPKHAN